MFDTLFGAEMPLAVRFFLAFVIVLGLIGATAWAVRRFGTGRLGASARGRQPRLAVIDYASVDGRRRLILVRRDNVEHLLMIGGPTDVVVEPNIVRAVAAPRDMPAARPAAAIETLSRAIPPPESGSNGSWPLQPEPTSTPRQSPRIEAMPDELPSRHFQPETPPRPQRDTLAALADELSARPTPPRNRAGVARPQPDELRQEQRTESRTEPRKPTAQAAYPGPAGPAPTAPAAAPLAADQNLVDMAQRLEAALRTPNTEARARPEQAVTADAAPPPPRTSRPSEPKTTRAEAKLDQSKTTLYDSLEQEMASLLGRPNKT
jgi:flagellar protein FliO/FliZ